MSSAIRATRGNIRLASSMVKILPFMVGSLREDTGVRATPVPVPQPSAIGRAGRERRVLASVSFTPLDARRGPEDYKEPANPPGSARASNRPSPYGFGRPERSTIDQTGPEVQTPRRDRLCAVPVG